MSSKEGRGSNLLLKEGSPLKIINKGVLPTQTPCFIVFMGRFPTRFPPITLWSAPLYHIKLPCQASSFLIFSWFYSRKCIIKKEILEKCLSNTLFLGKVVFPSMANRIFYTQTTLIKTTILARLFLIFVSFAPIIPSKSGLSTAFPVLFCHLILLFWVGHDESTTVALIIVLQFFWWVIVIRKHLLSVLGCKSM